MKTFCQMCLDGEAKIVDLQAYLSRWEVSNDNVSLSKYLGLTDDELHRNYASVDTLSDYIENKLTNYPNKATGDETL